MAELSNKTLAANCAASILIIQMFFNSAPHNLGVPQLTKQGDGHV